MVVIQRKLPEGEDRVSCKEAATLTDPPVVPRTIQRWAREGIATDAGAILLESELNGGEVYTSREALERFRRKLNGQMEV